MDRALWLLHRLRLRAALRRIVRGLKTPKGALASAFGLIMLAMFVLPNLLLATQVGRSDPQVVRTVAPVMMLGFSILTLLGTSAEKAVNFTLPEVEFLFPGPFTRRELLLYKVSASAAAALLTSLIFSVIFVRWTTWWFAGWAGLWLVMMFTQLLGMSLALVAQWIGETTYTRARRIVLAAAVILAGVTAAQMLPAGQGIAWHNFSEQLRASPVGTALVTPFEPFGRTIAAETLVDFAIWGSAALGIVVVLLVVVLRLDANYLEAAAVASQKRYELMQRAKSGQMPVMGARHTSRWRLPLPGWIGGAGPIAWRQAMQLMRSSPRLLLILVIVSLSAGPAFFTMGPQRTDLAGPIVGIVAWMSFFVVAVVPSGFRADLDYMDWFKMLPVHPLAIVIGELAPAVMFITVLQLLVIGGLGLFVPASPEILLAGACFTIPVNTLFLTAENMLFLYFPSRTVVASPGDLQFMGRQMLMVMLRMLLVGFAALIAVAPALLAWLIGVQAWAVLAAIVWVMLLAEGIALNFGTWLAFRCFDPSVDMPA
jgi:hypothetical protein